MNLRQGTLGLLVLSMTAALLVPLALHPRLVGWGTPGARTEGPVVLAASKLPAAVPSAPPATPTPAEKLNVSLSTAPQPTRDAHEMPVQGGVVDCRVPPGESLLSYHSNKDCRLAYLKAGNHPSCVSQSTLEYLKKYVLFAVITGSADRFFRADLGLCTWMYHVPESCLYFFTNNANTSEGRKGTWVEDTLPQGVRFSKEQLEAKGYSLKWIKAQYRFLFGLKHIIEVDRRDQLGKQWFLLIDDDTFVNLDGLVARLREYDKSPTGSGRYLGEKGWGGAGHFFDRAASEVLLQSMHAKCVERYMVKSFHASDEALRKCAPSLGLTHIREGTMSHCQATSMRERLLTGRHVTMHVKRDMVRPTFLAAWRMRLLLSDCVPR
eukprot:Sspe_Gene.116857::Locus_106938_Transcript_1_1_Confidence_1.000_Length_1187::g.116857::m.116857